jgi:hypothetical protein
MEVLTDPRMDECTRAMPELELALLRRGVHERATSCEGCSRCRRTPLIGERVYRAEGGRLLCELCRSREVDPPARSSIVHGPAFGHTIRILDQRAA